MTGSLHIPLSLQLLLARPSAPSTPPYSQGNEMFSSAGISGQSYTPRVKMVLSGGQNAGHGSKMNYHKNCPAYEKIEIPDPYQKTTRHCSCKEPKL